MVIDSVTAISLNLQSYTCNALVSKRKLSHTYLNIQPANKTHAHDLFFSRTRRIAEYHFIKKKEKCTRKREKTPSTQHTRLICRTQPKTRHDSWKTNNSWLAPTHEKVNDQPPEHGVTRLGWMSNSWSPTAPAEHHRALSFSVCHSLQDHRATSIITIIQIDFGRLLDESYETVHTFRYLQIISYA